MDKKDWSDALALAFGGPVKRKRTRRPGMRGLTQGDLKRGIFSLEAKRAYMKAKRSGGKTR